MTQGDQAPAGAVGGETDRRLLLLDPLDNCYVACTLIARATVIQADGMAMTILQDVPLGHKVARRILRAGDEVLRHGAVIGTVTRSVAPGEHLHLHNLKSGYLPTYTREDGARFAAAGAAPTRST